MATSGDRPGICVLGMHRSGTSVTASMLEELGVGLGGEDDLIPEHREHRGIVAIDDALLRAAGARWDDPPPSAAVAATVDAPPEDLRARAADLLGELRRRPVWGFKDPRASLTWPFWRRVAHELIPVVCLREPDAVARSLEQRDHFPPDKGLWLWTAYLAALLRDVAEQDALVILYDELLDDPRSIVDRLIAHAGLDAPPDAARRAAQLVRRDHREPPATAGRALRSAREAYALVRRSGLRAAADALAILGKLDDELRPQFTETWEQRVERMLATIAGAVPTGAVVAVIDDGSLLLPPTFDGTRLVRVDPELSDAVGPPADDAGACARLARARDAGATHLAISWPSSWWLDVFPSFAATLDADGHVLRDERVVLFRLGDAPAPSAGQRDVGGGQ